MREEKVVMGEGGVLAIPPAVCEEIGLKPGETIVLESDGDSVLLRAQSSVIREVQATVAAHIPLGAPVAGGLIAACRPDMAGESEPWGCGWTQPIA